MKLEGGRVKLGQGQISKRLFVLKAVRNSWRFIQRNGMVRSAFKETLWCQGGVSFSMEQTREGKPAG